MNRFHETDEYTVEGYTNKGVVIVRFNNLVGSEICPLVSQLRSDPRIVRVTIDIAFPDNDRDKTLINHLVEPLNEESNDQIIASLNVS